MILTTRLLLLAWDVLDLAVLSSALPSAVLSWASDHKLLHPEATAAVAGRIACLDLLPVALAVLCSSEWHLVNMCLYVQGAPAK